MDPLTTLLAAAAATGPNTLQSQALTALRSAGPQESFFTRMGNPHPLQVQQLAQPTTPQLNPIIAQPTSATALPQQFPMPIMPLASPLADPAPTALHIPTLQAIHRMQQQASPAPAMIPMMPQTPTTQPQATMPRDPAEYTQANFPSWPFWHSWRCRTSKHCAAAHTTSCSPTFRQWQGDLRRARDWATHSPPAPPHALWRQDKTHSSDFDQSHTQRQEGETDAPSVLQAGAVHYGHSTDAIADPGATAKTDDPAATERAELTGTDPGPLGPDPQAAPAVTKRLSSAADPNWASYQSKTSALLRR